MQNDVSKSGTVNRSGGNTVNRASGNTVNVNRTTYANRTVVANPVYVGAPAWGWNHGVVWYPAPAYWGGGFWGALAIAATSAAVFGSIVSANQTYTSYEVQPSSPGATLLKNYNLQQVACGPPGLVVVYGPNDSVICAMPNATVAAGSYDLDTQQLTLVSR